MKSLGIGEEKDRQYPEQEKYVGMENKKDRQYPEQEKYVGMENQEVWKYPIAGNGSAEGFWINKNSASNIMRNKKRNRKKQEKRGRHSFTY